MQITRTNIENANLGTSWTVLTYLSCFNKRAMRRASLSRTSQYWVTYIPFMISMNFLCQMWDNKVEANNVRQRHMFQQKALLLSSCTPPAVSSHHNANAPYIICIHILYTTMHCIYCNAVHLPLCMMHSIHRNNALNMSNLSCCILRCTDYISHGEKYWNRMPWKAMRSMCVIVKSANWWWWVCC